LIDALIGFAIDVDQIDAVLLHGHRSHRAAA